MILIRVFVIDEAFTPFWINVVEFLGLQFLVN